MTASTGIGNRGTAGARAVEPEAIGAGSSRPTARMVAFDESGTISLVERELPTPAPGQAIVRMIETLISPGSELRVLRRSYDAPHWARWATFPFFPGYSGIGVVEECAPDAGLRVGQRVVAACPHASRAVVPARACLPVESGMPPDAYLWCAFVKIAAMALPVIPSPVGRHLGVVGDGPLAQMVVRWLHCSGAQRITVVGRHQHRLQHALRGGASDTLLCDAMLPEPRGRGAPETVIDASGTASGFMAAQALAARRGTVVVLGDPGYPGELRFHPRFVPDGLHIVGAHDGQETEAWNAGVILRTFLRLVKTRAFDVSGLVTHRISGEQAKLAYDVCADKAASMGVVLQWERAPETS